MMRFLTSALALTAGLLGANVVAVARQQLPLIEHKEHLEEAGYTLFRHVDYPDQQMRYKRNDGWCKGADVRSWSGYLDFEDSHLFFYYYESRGRPSEDPLILWLDGGPGSSSAGGMLTGAGPCQIAEDADSKNTTASTKRNPYSWNQNANLLFLDQPYLLINYGSGVAQLTLTFSRRVGTGFSYYDHHKPAGTTDEAAKDVQAFLALFFETFSELKGRPFHIAGLSYAGRFIPVFAGAILDHNTKAAAGGMTSINLQSVMIGNGYTDVLTLIPTYYDQACTNISGAPTGPALSVHTCAEMQSYVATCQTWLNETCLDHYDVRACKAAYEKCSNIFFDPFLLVPRNPYNIAESCPTTREGSCYSWASRIVSLLNSPSTRKKLGVPLDGPAFSGGSPAIRSRFNRHMDQLPIIGTGHYTSALVERGINVLIYNGKYDWICNWLSNKIWLNNLVWTGSVAYLSEQMKPWSAKVGESVVKAGDTKTAYSLSGGKLTFATIEKAGHLVQYDQPEVAITMVNKWLNGEEL